MYIGTRIYCSADIREKMLGMICRVTFKDKVESTVIALRVGVDDLHEHLRQKRLKWFRHNCKWRWR